MKEVIDDKHIFNTPLTLNNSTTILALGKRVIISTTITCAHDLTIIADDIIFSNCNITLGGNIEAYTTNDILLYSAKITAVKKLTLNAGEFLGTFNHLSNNTKSIKEAAWVYGIAEELKNEDRDTSFFTGRYIKEALTSFNTQRG
jgi:hypothetical protein